MMACPYCLAIHSSVSFVQFKKTGKVSSIRRCRDCGSKFHASNALLRETTLDAYAKWIVDYPAGLFFKKVDFPIWAHILKTRGWADEFWLAYRKYKPKRVDYEEEAAAYDAEMARLDQMNLARGVKL